MKRTLPIVLFVLFAMLATPAQAASNEWLVPSGMVCPGACVAAALIGDQVGDGGSVVPPGADRSMGYSPGTSWPTLAFGCPGQLYQGQRLVWWGQDDDHTYSDVKFPQPIQVSGVGYFTLAWSDAHSAAYPHLARFFVSNDGVNYRQVGAISTFLAFNTWTQEVTTWPATSASYFRWMMDDQNDLGVASSFTNAVDMRFLAPSTTSRNC